MVADLFMLVADVEKYSGEYVIMDGKDSKDVVSHDKEPDVAYNKAISQGISDPIMLYVPSSNEGHFIF